MTDEMDWDAPVTMLEFVRDLVAAAFLIGGGVVMTWMALA